MEDKTRDILSKYSDSYCYAVKKPSDDDDML